MSGSNPETYVDRTSILKRFAVTLVCLIFFEVVGLLVQLSVLFQYAYLLIAKRRSEPLRRFTNSLAHYAYRIIRFTTLNDNVRPFPFGPYPADSDLEPSVKVIQYK